MPGSPHSSTGRFADDGQRQRLQPAALRRARCGSCRAAATSSSAASSGSGATGAGRMVAVTVPRPSRLPRCHLSYHADPIPGAPRPPARGGSRAPRVCTCGSSGPARARSRRSRRSAPGVQQRPHQSGGATARPPRRASGVRSRGRGPRGRVLPPAAGAAAPRGRAGAGHAAGVAPRPSAHAGRRPRRAVLSTPRVSPCWARCEQLLPLLPQRLGSRPVPDVPGLLRREAAGDGAAERPHRTLALRSSSGVSGAERARPGRRLRATHRGSAPARDAAPDGARRADGPRAVTGTAPRATSGCSPARCAWRRSAAGRGRGDGARPPPAGRRLRGGLLDSTTRARSRPPLL